MPETGCRNTSDVLVFVTRERYALSLHPLPILVVVGRTEEGIRDLCYFIAAKESVDLRAASFDHCFILQLVLVSASSLCVKGQRLDGRLLGPFRNPDVGQNLSCCRIWNLTMGS